MHELLIQAAIDTGDIAELEQALQLEAPSIQKAVSVNPRHPRPSLTVCLNQALSCWDDFIPTCESRQRESH